MKKKAKKPYYFVVRYDHDGDIYVELNCRYEDKGYSRMEGGRWIIFFPKLFARARIERIKKRLVRNFMHKKGIRERNDMLEGKKKMYSLDDLYHIY